MSTTPLALARRFRTAPHFAPLLVVVAALGACRSRPGLSRGDLDAGVTDASLDGSGLDMSDDPVDTDLPPPPSHWSRAVVDMWGVPHPDLTVEDVGWQLWDEPYFPANLPVVGRGWAFGLSQGPYRTFYWVQVLGSRAEEGAPDIQTSRDGAGTYQFAPEDVLGSEFLSHWTDNANERYFDIYRVDGLPVVGMGRATRPVFESWRDTGTAFGERYLVIAERTEDNGPIHVYPWLREDSHLVEAEPFVVPDSAPPSGDADKRPIGTTIMDNLLVLDNRYARRIELYRLDEMARPDHVGVIEYPEEMPDDTSAQEMRWDERRLVFVLYSFDRVWYYGAVADPWREEPELTRVDDEEVVFPGTLSAGCGFVFIDGRWNSVFRWNGERYERDDWFIRVPEDSGIDLGGFDPRDYNLYPRTVREDEEGCVMGLEGVGPRGYDYPTTLFVYEYLPWNHPTVLAGEPILGGDAEPSDDPEDAGDPEESATDPDEWGNDLDEYDSELEGDARDAGDAGLADAELDAPEHEAGDGSGAADGGASGDALEDASAEFEPSDGSGAPGE